MVPEILDFVRGPYALPVLLGATVVYLLSSYVVAYRRLREFDGPWLGKFSTLWMAYQVPKLQQGPIYHDVMRRYAKGGGSLVRVGPNDLVTDSPEIVRRMGSARSTYSRSSWYHAVKFNPYGDSVLSTMDTAAHDKLKAKLVFGYAGKDVPGVEGIIDDQLLNWIALIRTKYLSHEGPGGFKPMDLGKTTSYFTLDTITRLAYGEAFGFIDGDKDVVGYLRIVEESLPAIVMGCEIPFMQAILLNPTFLKFFGPKPTDTDGMGVIMGVAQKVVGERFGPDAKEKQDMLGSFIRHGISMEQCEQEVLLQIPAGSDTSATAIRGTVSLLSQSPSAFNRLRREIDETVRRHGMTEDQVISVELAKTLPYLQAVIYEGIRMSPPFTGLLMKQVPAGGDTLEGRFVPAGTRIGVATKALLMRRDVFGPDVDMFRPERFLECNDATRANLQNTVELAFGYGRWMCAGKPIAFMELNKVYFELFRRFDFQLTNTKNPGREISGNIQFHADLFVKITERIREQ